MLAQNFMSAADLGIPDEHRSALIQVLGMLEREEIPGHFGSARGAAFDMGNWWKECYDKKGWFCGTVGCIAGWAEHVGEVNFRGALYEHGKKLPQLEELFYVQSLEGVVELSAITPKQAAAALRNYLTTGRPCWAEVLAPQITAACQK